MKTRVSILLPALVSAMVLSSCGSLGPTSPPSPQLPSAAEARGYDVVLFAIGLVETGYRFGGKNPDAGMDCSGMVSYVFDRAAGLKLAGSAADIARKGRSVEPAKLRPGDLVFFNTTNRPHSHVGIYIGDQRFVHAPSSNGRVRTDSLKTGWFAARFEEARTYFN